MDFTTRMFVRDYAFLHAMRPHQSADATCNFAMVATGLWHLAVASVCLVLVNVLLMDFIPDAVGILTANHWVAFGQCALLAFLIKAFVERKARPFENGVLPEILERFSSRRERFKWWCTTLSLIPLAAVLGYLVFIGKFA
jgi:hypothetical protein